MYLRFFSRFSCALALVAFLGLAAAAKPAAAKPAAGQAKRLTEPAGGFSYLPPPGWHVRTFPGAKYNICFAKPANGFAPNINVTDEIVAAPLGKYFQMSQPSMRRVYSSFHVRSQSLFATSAQLQGIRVTVDGTLMNRAVRQVFYVFPAANDRKIIVTASWLASDGNKYAQAVDASMKTFKLL